MSKCPIPGMCDIDKTLFPAGHGPLSWTFRATGASLAFMLYARTPLSKQLFASGAVASALGIAYGATTKTVPTPPLSTPVPAGKTRICISGYTHSAPTANAHYLADAIAKELPGQFESWYYWDATGYFPFVGEKFANVDFPEHLKGHATSPFVWIERGADNKVEPIGTADLFHAWALDQANGVAGNPVVAKLAASPTALPVSVLTGDAFHVTNGKGKAMTA